MRFLLAVLMLAGAVGAQPRTEAIPSTEGAQNRVTASPLFFTISPGTAQVIFSADGLRNLRAGDLITGFDFRGATAGASSPAAFLSFANFDIVVGRGAMPVGQMSILFADNFASKQTVRTGPFGLAANSLPAAGAPNPWGAFVEFDVPYVYTGGDLVMQLSHSGTGQQNASIGVTTEAGLVRSILAPSYQALRSSVQPQDLGPLLRLRVQPAGPYFSGKSVTNGASGRIGTLSPGTISTLYGTDLGPAGLALGGLNAAGTRFETSAGGTRVLVDGVAAPVLYSIAGQVSFIAPYAIAGKGAVSVTVEYGGKTNTAFVAVVPTDPALFTANQSGRGQGAILNQDATVNSAANPAVAGSIIVLYGTGAGQTTPGGVDGQLDVNSPPSRPLAQPTLVTIGGQNAEVVYSGAAPGAVAGLWQINVRVPAGMAANNSTPVTLRIGDSGTLTGVTLAIR